MRAVLDCLLPRTIAVERGSAKAVFAARLFQPLDGEVERFCVVRSMFTVEHAPLTLTRSFRAVKCKLLAAVAPCEMIKASSPSPTRVGGSAKEGGKMRVQDLIEELQNMDPELGAAGAVRRSPRNDQRLLPRGIMREDTDMVSETELRNAKAQVRQILRGWAFVNLDLRRGKVRAAREYAESIPAELKEWAQQEIAQVERHC